jgi:hypothetical protein
MARIVERHDGEPPPASLIERDPNLKSWSAHLIGGKKMQLLGYIEAVSEAAAIANRPVADRTGAPRSLLSALCRSRPVVVMTERRNFVSPGPEAVRWQGRRQDLVNALLMGFPPGDRAHVPPRVSRRRPPVDEASVTAPTCPVSSTA